MLCGSGFWMSRCLGCSLLQNFLHSASERVQLLSAILRMHITQGADEFVQVHALVRAHGLLDAVLELLVLHGPQAAASGHLELKQLHPRLWTFRYAGICERVLSAAVAQDSAVHPSHKSAIQTCTA